MEGNSWMRATSKIRHLSSCKQLCSTHMRILATSYCSENIFCCSSNWKGCCQGEVCASWEDESAQVVYKPLATMTMAWGVHDSTRPTFLPPATLLFTFAAFTASARIILIFILLARRAGTGLYKIIQVAHSQLPLFSYLAAFSTQPATMTEKRCTFWTLILMQHSNSLVSFNSWNWLLQFLEFWRTDAPSVVESWQLQWTHTGEKLQWTHTGEKLQWTHTGEKLGADAQ